MTDTKMTAVDIAHRCHEMNRVWCQIVGDTHQPTWDESPLWQKDSAVMGVRSLLEDPVLTPQDMHERWMAHKFNDGWMHGPIKDPVAKQHPCMIPYCDLPPEQRAKDHIFHAVVKGLMHRLSSG